MLNSLCKTYKFQFYFSATLLLVSLNLYSQSDIFSKFKKLSCAEKKWVLFHPFAASRAMKISENAIKTSQELAKDTILDGDENGGQVDAFRHAYWMATLTQSLHWRKVYKLGKAHERGNYKDFKKHRNEDGTIPDYPSCQMDFLNNDCGIQIGREHKDFSDQELKSIIISEIKQGKLYVIKKNMQGNFIDCDGNIIVNEELKGKWENNKCIVRSNYIRQ